VCDREKNKNVKIMKNIFILVLCFFTWSCTNETPETVAATNQIKKTETERKEDTSKSTKKEYDKIPLDKIKLPDGFKIEVFAAGIDRARSLALSPNETLFVGTMSKKGVVTAVKNGQHYKLSEGWEMPNGVAFKDGDLYVAEVSKIHKFEDIENNLDAPKEEVIYDKYPTESHHGWKFISFGPDGKLYVPVGAPCNICEKEEEIYGTITRINPDGTGFEIVQKGIRNTVGFTWHPDNKELWFTDNGRDMWGDDTPGCEVNHAPKDGMHFGYPYCHQGDLPEDDESISKHTCEGFTPPAKVLRAHVAPLGIEFIPAGNFPKKYEKQILVAEHGSWNRTKKQGYRLALLTLDENDQVKSSATFADGWLNEDDDVWGRPVDMEFMKDGSLLVSDDMADVVYRIFYEGN
jgi:glucose/arabinose dehydrogenase